MAIKALNLKGVIEKVTLGKTAIYAGIKNGTFPAPAKIGERRSAWLESEVDQWLADRFGERPNAAKGRV